MLAMTLFHFMNIVYKMKTIREILKEISLIEDADIINTKFAQKLANKRGMYKVPGLSIPVSPSDQTPFIRFETEDGPKHSYIYGIRPDGRKEKISVGSKKVTDLFAQIYNSGGYTDRDIQKINLKDKFTENKIVASDRIVDPKESLIKYQASCDKDINFRQAEQQKIYYQQLIAKLVQGIDGAKPYDKGEGGPLGVRVKKKMGRVDSKIKERGDASLISDYLGGAIEVKSLQAMKSILKRIQNSGHRILEIDNMLSGKEKDEGYRAVHMQVQLKNGFSAELQLLPDGIARVKEQLHPTYEKYRTPEAEERATKDPEFKAKMDATHEKLAQTYDKAFKQFKKTDLGGDFNK
jgi:hypothetical protein